MLNRAVSRNSSCGSKISEENAVCPYLFKNVAKLHEDFKLGEPLGKGGFGQIFKTKRRCDDKEFAVKIIKFESNAEYAGKYRREAKMLSLLDHNNIVRYYNSWIETAKISRSEYEDLKSDSENSLSSEIDNLSKNGYIAETNQDGDDCQNEENDEKTELSHENVELNYLFIQMELCDKRTLRTAIIDDLYLEETRVAKYFKEICEGLLHMHNMHIVHRDLKPENIFLTSGDVIKIGDFGLSKQITLIHEAENPPTEEIFGSLTDVCGTNVYIAPELYVKKLFNSKADIYSLGIIYFEMCSKSMTEMEKSRTFPLSPHRIKALNFSKNSSKKKFLIRNMMHSNYNERPTCENILKILNSEKSINDVREMIHRNRKAPAQQIKAFQRVLRANTSQSVNLTNFFMKTAIRIFELHGAQNISIPTFLPAFNNYCYNLTTFLNINGNSVSVSNTSRIGLAHYAAKNNITKLRRYSVGKTFEEGYFLPSETQECVFEAISSESDDYVNDAEILYIAKEICDGVLKSEIGEICFFINHRSIFSTILRHCKIADNNATVFTNMMIEFSKKVSIEKELRLVLSTLELDTKVIDFILRIWTPCNLLRAPIELAKKFKKKYKQLQTVFEEFDSFVTNATKFGIKYENIYLSPLLMNEKIYSSMMFKVELKEKAIIATGGRFDSLIKQCMRQNRAGEIPEVSAIGISFNVNNILQLVSSCDEIGPVLGVAIYAKEKATAIPLLTELLSREIKCQIETKLFDFGLNNGFSLLIVLSKEDYVDVYRLDQLPNRFSAMNVVYSGDWKNSQFFDVVCNNLN